MDRGRAFRLSPVRVFGMAGRNGAACLCRAAGRFHRNGRFFAAGPWAVFAAAGPPLPLWLFHPDLEGLSFYVHRKKGACKKRPLLCGHPDCLHLAVRILKNHFAEPDSLIAP